MIRLANVLGIDNQYDTPDGLLNVIVYIEDQRSFGLVVNQIVDIVEATVELSENSLRRGLLGSAIIQDHVTDLVDLPAIIEQLEHGNVAIPQTSDSRTSCHGK